MAGLNVSNVVRVDINLAPIAAPLRNFGALLIAGTSGIIDPVERIRQYSSLDGVVSDFGVGSPEFLAADLFFSQRPAPSILYIGGFYPTGSRAILHGGIFATQASYQLLQRLKLIEDGTLKITVDGTERQVSESSGALRSGPFSTTTKGTLHATLLTTANGAFDITIDGTLVALPVTDLTTIDPIDIDKGLADAATKLGAGFAAAATMTWDDAAGGFLITSATTGTTSTVSYAAPATAATATDLSATLKLTAAAGAVPPTTGTLGMNFKGIVSLNGAAKILDDALAGVQAWWDGTRFHVQSTSTGTTSSIGYAEPAAIGTDVSGLLALTELTGASIPVQGSKAESPLEAAARLRADPSWYGLMFAAPIDDLDHLAVGQFIEGCNPMAIYGYTTQDTTVLDPTNDFDLASLLHGATLSRTFGQYSSSSPYAVASLFGRAFTVDFEASNSMITLKFKQEPGVTAERLTETEAAALAAKRCNVFVYYSNDTAIVQEGVMANGFFFDEVHGTDWLANRIQTDVYNVLYTAPTKLPQTNQGVHVLVTTVENALAQGAVNGLIAPGQWNAPGFGQIVFGQMLAKGYYVWAPLVESQPQSIREQRIAPTIQCAIKLAGAIHRAYVIVNVNR
jgi:hypothetical protein